MKKIFTLSLLCLLSVAAAKAQLKITNGTQEVTNGSVLTFTATEIAEIGLVDCAPSDPKITNVSGEKGTHHRRKIEAAKVISSFSSSLPRDMISLPFPSA